LIKCSYLSLARINGRLKRNSVPYFPSLQEGTEGKLKGSPSLTSPPAGGDKGEVKRRKQWKD